MADLFPTKQQFYDAEKDLRTVNAVSNSRDPDTGAEIDTWVTRRGDETDTLAGRLKKLGVVFAGDTATGCTLSNLNEVVLNNTAGSSGFGNYYSWAGVFPHAVTPGTDPALAGSAYTARTDIALRANLAASTGANLVGTEFGMTLSAFLSQISPQIASSYAVTSKMKSVTEFGVVGDGSDETVEMQAALDSGKPVYIPSGMGVTVSQIFMTKQFSGLYGPGSLNGQIVVAMPNVGDPYQSIIAACRIHNVRFLAPSSPILLRRGRAILIDGNTFSDTVGQCVLVQPTAPDFDAANHCVEDVNITGNMVSMVDRLLKIDTSQISAQLDPNWWLGNGDIHVTNNIVRVAKICHISADRVDGLTVSGNTFLHYGSGVASKTYCVDVSTRGSQVMIYGNEFFEPGRAAIRLHGCQNFNIQLNNFIDCGQLVPSSAIEIVYTLTPGVQTSLANGTVANNTINGTTAHGVLVSNTSNVSVFRNNITLKSSPVYYGSTAVAPFGDRYGVYTEQSGTSGNVAIDDNTVVDAPTRQYNAWSAVGLTGNKLTRYDESTANSALLGNYEQVNLVQPAGSVITSVSGGYEGKVLRLITFNGNTTIANNSTIKTGTGSNKALSADSIYTLTRYGTVWYLK